METRRKKISPLIDAAAAAAAKPSGFSPALRSKWLPRRSLAASSPRDDSHKSVFLHRWWLVKVNGDDLAVGGFADKHQSVSLFQSTAIAKRHNDTNLETVDGMMVVLIGIIDQLRTNENGFPNEVCHRFKLGFPLDWERHRDLDFSAEHVLHPGDFPRSHVSSISLDDVPAARMRDLMFGLGESESDCLMRNICDDTLKALGKAPQSEQEGELGPNGDEELGKAAAGEARENCESPSRVKHTVANGKEASATKGIPKGGKGSDAAGGAIVPSRVSTRSMTRSMRCDK